jgi:predicted kinase
MAKPTLYLFIGYPGAGKTTVAKIISHVTGAFHIWADIERHRRFKSPTHSQEESQELYEQLNDATNYLLAEGKSVAFDTNFNYLSDREKLRKVADKNDANTILIWINTPIEVSRKRAVTSEMRNLYEVGMTNEQFDAIASKLEKPVAGEQVIKVDGTNLNQETLLNKLGIST